MNHTDVLLLQHSEGSPPGSTIEWLNQNQLQYQIHFWGKDPSEKIKSISFNFLIILGGPQNVDEEEKYPWLRIEKEFIKSNLLQKIPTLGICLGGQLMAETLGAEVRRQKHWEIGWHQILLSPERNPLLPINKELHSFQFHGYGFTSPTNGISLGANEVTPCQAFGFESHAIGLQFHPESTSDWVHKCCEEIEDSTEFTGPFVQKPPDILKQISNQVHLQNWYFELLNRFKEIL